MRALVTNDDGVLAPGLVHAALAVLASGHEVIVAAPLEESSGSSCSLASVREDGRTVVRRQPLQALGETPVFAVGASPAFISLMALQGVFGAAPELVVSGVNEGPNTGRAVIHSGTVGAALTAATYGARGLAVSMELGQPRHWETVASVLLSAIDLVAKAPVGTTLNLNVPNRPVDQLRGFRSARLAPVGMVQMQVADRGEGFVRLDYGAPAAEADPDTDAALLAAGFSTITALRPTGETGLEALAHLLPT